MIHNQILHDKLFEANHSTTDSYPDVLILSSGERLHYRKVELVLRYHVPNKFKDPEGYAHHLLFLFYPFRDECKLKVGQPSSYSSKLREPGVIEVINKNKSLVEPYRDLVNDAFLNHRSGISHSWNPFSQQENDDVENELCEINEQAELSSQDIKNRNNQTYSEVVSSQVQAAILSDSEINSKIRSLKLKHIFDFIFNWAKLQVKINSGVISNHSKPFHMFFSGNGGCAESHLIKTIYYEVDETFFFGSGDPGKPRILLLAATGVTATNINGNTIQYPAEVSFSC